MKPYPLIGLAGKAHSGKSTVAAMIAKTVPNTQSVALAYHIKEMVRAVFNVDPDGPDKENPVLNVTLKSWEQITFQLTSSGYGRVHNWLDGSYRNVAGEPPMGNMSPRQLMQAIGTVVRVLCGKDYWSKKLVNDIDKILLYGDRRGQLHGKPTPDLIVVPDIRHRNELLAIREMGGKVYKIESPDVLVMDHQSETELDTIPKWWYDGIIQNSKQLGLERLELSVQDLILPSYR